MTHRKHGLGLLGGLLAIAALGVMLFAAGAQAKNVTLLVKKADGTKVAVNHATLPMTATANDDNFDGVLLVKALNFEIRCTNFTVQQGLILTEKDADAKLLYEGCEPLTLALAPISACHILDPLDKTKLHITADALLLPIELKEKDFGFLADVTKVEVLMTGPECVLPEKTLITGTVCGLIEEATNNTPTLLVLFSEAIQLNCLEGAVDKLAFGAQTAYIDGRANISLIAPHLGFKLHVELP